MVARRPAAPNIVFVLVDDMGYGDFSRFNDGLSSTPTLDSLIDEIVSGIAAVESEFGRIESIGIDTTAGVFGLLEDGDTVTVDIPERELSVDLSDDELNARRDEWEPREPNYTSGVLGKYARDFGSAAEGAITNPGLLDD